MSTTRNTARASKWRRHSEAEREAERNTERATDNAADDFLDNDPGDGDDGANDDAKPQHTRPPKRGRTQVEQPWRFDDLPPAGKRKRLLIATTVSTTVIAAALGFSAPRVLAIAPSMRAEASCEYIADIADAEREALMHNLDQTVGDLAALETEAEDKAQPTYGFISRHTDSVDALRKQIKTLQNTPPAALDCSQLATKRDANDARSAIGAAARKLDKARHDVFATAELERVEAACATLAIEVRDQEKITTTINNEFDALGKYLTQAEDELRDAREKDNTEVEYAPNDEPIDAKELAAAHGALEGLRSRFDELRARRDAMSPPQRCQTGIQSREELPAGEDTIAQSYSQLAADLGQLSIDTIEPFKRAKALQEHATRIYDARIAEHERVVAEKKAEEARQALAKKQQEEFNRMQLTSLDIAELERMSRQDAASLPAGVTHDNVTEALDTVRAAEAQRAKEKAEAERQAAIEAEAERLRAEEAARKRAIEQQRQQQQQQQQQQNQRRQSSQQQNLQRQQPQQQPRTQQRPPAHTTPQVPQQAR